MSEKKSMVLLSPSLISEARKAVSHYKRKLKHNDGDSSIILHSLNQLHRIPVNVLVLQETNVGPVVRYIKKSSKYDKKIISKATQLIQKWKDVVTKELEVKIEPENENGHNSEEENAKSPRIEQDGGASGFEINVSPGPEDYGSPGPETYGSPGPEAYGSPGPETYGSPGMDPDGYDSPNEFGSEYKRQQSSASNHYRSQHSTDSNNLSKDSSHRHRAGEANHYKSQTSIESSRYKTQSSVESNQYKSQTSVESSHRHSHTSSAEKKRRDSDKEKDAKYKDKEKQRNSERESKGKDKSTNGKDHKNKNGDHGSREKERSSHKEDPKPKDANRNEKDRKINKSTEDDWETDTPKKKSEHHDKYKDSKSQHSDGRDRKKEQTKQSLWESDREKERRKEKDRKHSDGDGERRKEKKHKHNSHDSDGEQEQRKEKKHKHSSKDKGRSSNPSGGFMDFESAMMAADKPDSKSSKTKFQSSGYSRPSDTQRQAFTSKFGDLTATSSKSKMSSVPVPVLPPLPDINIPIDINPNYKPLKNRPPVPSAPSRHHNNSKGIQDDDNLSALIAKSKYAQRSVVYSGHKRSVFGDTVPKLYDLCIHVLQERVDEIGECGGLPYEILEPILERAMPDSLMTIEEYNPYLVESTGSLWERICRKHFPRHDREEFESWRELYERCTVARSAKLDELAERVQQSYKNVHSTSRKTKLAFVDTIAKPPRNVLRAQAKNGTGLISAPIKRTTGGPPRPPKESGSGISGAGPSVRHPLSVRQKPRVAPMMAKTLKLALGIKTNFRK